MRGPPLGAGSFYARARVGACPDHFECYSADKTQRVPRHVSKLRLKHRFVMGRWLEDAAAARVEIRSELEHAADRSRPRRLRCRMIAAQRFPISIILVPVRFDESETESRKR